MPKISIITPVYIDIEDKINWLDEMIQSVLRQTVTDWELILIDDKSPVSFDGLKQRYNNDSRLRWLENAANCGPAKTRNTAVALAESDCILPLDSDDMLATNDTLEAMYDAWSMDKTKIIYGNIQLYTLNQAGEYQRSKIHQLAQYSIEGAMHLEFGIMPVTTMHSREAHIKAGGWKSELTHGREDLEYWIACGVKGYCGLKINHTTLLYRKHEQSRDYRLKFENQQLRAMQEKIKAMHSDIYNGRFPMGCCGKTSTNNPPSDPLVLSQQAAGVTRITELQGYEEKDLEWVAYNGSRKGRFDILAKGPVGLPSSYTILGTGHVFQIHKRHRDIFSARATMKFAMNQPDPRQQSEPEPEIVEPPKPQVVAVPKPELSTLVRLDSVGSQTREAEVIIEPNPPNSYTDQTVPMPTNYFVKTDINSLGFGPGVTGILDEAGYTVEKLAEATSKELMKLPSIGKKRAKDIINSAKELLND